MTDLELAALRAEHIGLGREIERIDLDIAALARCYGRRPTAATASIHLQGIVICTAERDAVEAEWSSIAFDLFAKTEVRITPETLRVWFADDLTSAAS